MYKRELDALIYAKKLPNFILLRSRDAFLNELYTEEILNYWNAENLYSVYPSEYDFESIRSFLAPSLFGGKNAVYIKSVKFGSTKEIKSLIEICKKDKNCFLLYEFLENDENHINDAFIKTFEGNFVRLFSPNNPNETLQILNKKCKSLKLYPNNAALLEIYQIHGENLNLTAAELEKFASLNYPLNLENVKTHVTGLSEVSFEELFKKIINLEDFRDEFFTYIESSGYNESEFISYTYNYMYRIFKIHTHIKLYGQLDFRAILGYTPPPLIQNELKKEALKFSTAEFKEMFKVLNETEFTLKTKNGVEKTYFLLSQMMKFQRVFSK
ncbi:MAG: hypothetical protein GXZ15_00720 [Campylobacter sp.]|nr:hypothetical protein [Campylobacter sp.]